MGEHSILHSFPDRVFDSPHPFLDGRFHQLIERSGSATKQTGWTPLHFCNGESILPGYIKEHSYGEYIFDWAWADFYYRLKLPYYPKLVHALPFTPINAAKFLGEENSKLAEDSFNFYQNNEQISGEHYLFADATYSEFLTPLGFCEMKTIQYHFQNKFKCFDDFLCSLKPNRKKMIRKERKKVEQAHIEIREITDKNCDQQALTDVYQLYLSTINKKFAHAYLTKEFFLGITHYFKDSFRILAAYKDEKMIAMSLFFQGEKTLYGRYWGILPEYENDCSFLHFEMCYYRGMEICFQEKLELFEAGAQGEHKLWRGFTPVEIYSYHHIRIPQLFDSIKNYIQQQNFETIRTIEQLKSALPYK